VTNRNGMCPRKKGRIKSNSQYLVWPPAALSTAVHRLLMDCTRFARSCCEMMLPHSSTKTPVSSRTFLGGNGPSPHPLIQQDSGVLNGIEIRALRWPWQNTDRPVLKEISHTACYVRGGIVMLEGHVRRSLQEGYHMRELMSSL
jgi:hypothetical protein